MNKIMILSIIMFSLLAVFVSATMSVNLVTPDNNAWNTTSNVTFAINITGNYTAYNGTVWISGHGVSWHANETKVNIANGSLAALKLNYLLSDNATGYTWNVIATPNSTNAENATGSSNRTVKVDTAVPTSPDLRFPWNGSLSTDTIPTIEWNFSTEANFNRYWLRVSTSSDFSSPLYETNITNSATNRTTLESGSNYEMAVNTKYYINVTAYDLSNQTNSTTNVVVYRTMDGCRSLVAGWNVCAIIRNSSTTTALYAANFSLEINNLSYVAKYNTTNQYQIHQIGASSNADMLFNVSSAANDRDAVVFLYVETNVSWKGFNSTKPGRTTFFKTANSNQDFNMTNQSNGWQVLPLLTKNTADSVPTTRTFLNISTSMAQSPLWNGSNYANITGGNISNQDVPFMAFINNSKSNGSRSVPYVPGWNINENVTILYGEAFWVWLNQSVMPGLINNSRYWNVSKNGSSTV